jgi:hypothetical protein
LREHEERAGVLGVAQKKSSDTRAKGKSEAGGS